MVGPLVNGLSEQRLNIAGFLEHTHSKGSCWFPSPDSVAESKKTGVGWTSFTQLLEFAFGNGSVVQSQMDMTECAMWWEMPEADAYGAYSADGVFKIREDMGGALALAEGIRRVRASGRRIQLYLSADIAHRGSPLFNASWSASRCKPHGTSAGIWLHSSRSH